MNADGSGAADWPGRTPGLERAADAGRDGGRFDDYLLSAARGVT